MDIDLVYLWVDGNDPVWLTKKNEFLPADRQVDPQVAGECRYVENDELRYSLRSVEKYAPWIRRVYIVTDDHVARYVEPAREGGFPPGNHACGDFAGIQFDCDRMVLAIYSRFGRAFSLCQ